MLSKIYLGLAVLALGFYTITTFAGREFGSTKLSSKPPSAHSGGRSGGGGFFFGGGYGGGK